MSAAVEQQQASRGSSAAGDVLLEVTDLHTHFVTSTRTVRATEGVSLTLRRGELLGIVGESGSGKSVTNLAIMGLLAHGRGQVVRGRIVFKGQDLTQMTADAHRRLRGRELGMVFQDPMSSLNPYLTVGEQLVEGPMFHLGVTRSEAEARTIQLLTRVGIADAKSRLGQYPHEMSGGMRQRILLAMALLCDPELLILDEPTTALDVTVQAQILDLIRELRAERQLSAIFVTHDLGVVSELCDRVLVMYAGRVVEEASTQELFSAPAHPYTRALLASRPAAAFEAPPVPLVAEMGTSATAPKRRRLATIEGVPPRLDSTPLVGCAFAPRCASAREVCVTEEPPVREIVRDARPHRYRCILEPSAPGASAAPATVIQETP